MQRLGTRPAVLGGAAALAKPTFTARARVPDAALYHAYLEKVFDARWFTNQGPLAVELEQQLTCRFGAPTALVSNATVGLMLALRALDLEGEVITTPFTFPASVHSIAWNGLTPVFCDVDPHTYNLDTAAASRLVTDRTCAILGVHVFGNPCDVVGLEELASRRKLAIVYDAAHAFDVRLGGRPISQFGDLSVFSFHATKLFHAGEGGAVTDPRGTWLRAMQLLRNFGIVDEERVNGIGINAKMSELHAAMGLCLLDGTSAEIARRREVDAAYRRVLGEVPGLRLQRVGDDVTRNYAYCSIEVDEPEFGLSRDEVHRALRAENIVARKYFYPLCSENAAYAKEPSARPEALPNAHRLAQRILCLPVYGELGADDAVRIGEALARLRDHAAAVRDALRGRAP